MREIKFRARHKGTGEWWYGDMEWVHPAKDGYDKMRLSEFWGLFFAGIFDNKTVGQYTGLKDSKGQEIYEGDIIKYLNEIHPIVWGEAEWLLDGYEWECACGHFCEINWDNLEVIGNIYGNKELL